MTAEDGLVIPMDAGDEDALGSGVTGVVFGRFAEVVGQEIDLDRVPEKKNQDQRVEPSSQPTDSSPGKESGEARRVEVNHGVMSGEVREWIEDSEWNGKGPKCTLQFHIAKDRTVKFSGKKKKNINYVENIEYSGRS